MLIFFPSTHPSVVERGGRERNNSAAGGGKKMVGYHSGAWSYETATCSEASSPL